MILSHGETMVLMANIDLPVRAVREYIYNAINITINIERLSDGKRKVSGISEIVGFNGDEIELNDIFTFNQEGLTIKKSDVDITTNISEDGMKVSKGSEVVLTANNGGVEARNLHATTYLIIGENSRFEDYDNGSRTGCFWIGG